MPTFFMTATGTLGPLKKYLNTLAAGSNVLLVSSGQSNWEGVAETPGDTSGVLPVRSQWWNIYANGGQGAFTLIEPGNGYRPMPNPSIYLVAEFERLYPNLNLYLIETGRGGEGFQTTSKAGNGGGGFAPGNEQETDLLEAITKGTEELRALNEEVYVLGFLWNQGEGDAYNLGDANAYQVNLQSLYEKVEALTVADITFVPVRITSQGTYQYQNIIRGVQETIGYDFVNVDDLDTANGPHFTNAAYVTIGQRQLAAIAPSALKKLPTTVTTPEPEPPVVSTLDISFAGLSALPDGWSLSPDAGALSFDSYGLRLQTAASQNWGVSVITGPVWDKTRPLEVHFKSPSSHNAYGAALNPIGWLGAGPSSLMTLYNSVYLGNSQQGGSFTRLTAGDDFKLTYTVIGSDVLIEIFKASGALVHSQTVADVVTALDGAKIALDAAYGEMRVSRVKN